MYKITLKSNRGIFMIELKQDSFQFNVGDKIYCKSSYYVKSGTYVIVKIEHIN